MVSKHTQHHDFFGQRCEGKGQSLTQLPKADLFTFWFSFVGPFVVMPPKGDHLLFLGPNRATKSNNIYIY